MIFGILVLITALSISSVAIYYSVAGLVAIFSSAVVPVMIMGGVLEVSKLVTTAWLHHNWRRTSWWLKTYLTAAVLLLMIITSMGIFGFLSKAHLEQTTYASQAYEQIEFIDEQNAERQEIIDRAMERIAELERRSVSSDSAVQEQIDRVQAEIDSVYDRMERLIAPHQEIIDNYTQSSSGEVGRLRSEISNEQSKLTLLQEQLDSGDVRAAQAMVGVEVDGALGPATRRAISEFQSRIQSRIESLQSQLQTAQQRSTEVPERVVAAQNEIDRIREEADAQTDESTALISRLRTQIGTTDRSDIEEQITEQRRIVSQARTEIQESRIEQSELRQTYRELEVEVGPIKFIAEFLYGDSASTDMLESAVRWVIILIIVVFDPLAVLLLVAAQETFKNSRKDKTETPVQAEKLLNTTPVDYEPEEGPEIVSAETPEDRDTEETVDEEFDVGAEDVEQEANVVDDTPEVTVVKNDKRSSKVVISRYND